MQEWQKFVTKVYVMGVGMATGAYDLLVINFVMLILEDLHTMSSWEKSLVATSSLVGTVSGQLIFGLLGDKIGRRMSSILTCSILLIAAIGSGFLSYHFGGDPIVMYFMLAAWRLILGLGIGGEFPVTALLTGEDSASVAGKRGTLIAGMFSSQGLGNVMAAVVVLTLLISMPLHLNWVWRLALALGGLPPLLILFPRYKISESKHFTSSSHVQVSIKKTLRVCWKRLIGTAGCWFLFDLVFYANSLFSGPILRAVGIADESGWLGITNNVSFNVIITLLALPGYWCGTFLIDRVGRKQLQVGGFLMMAIMYIAISLSYTWLTEYATLFTVLYGLSYFFANAGPNTTNFVIPIETYPSSIRSTCHGISAASGKFGAILGALFISPLLDATDPQFIFLLCGLTSVGGAVLTVFFIHETMHVDLEKLDEEIMPHILQDQEVSSTYKNVQI